MSASRAIRSQLRPNCQTRCIARRARIRPPPMPTETLSHFIDLLEKNGELARVKAKVSPVLEIAEIADRVSKSPAPHAHNELDRSPAARLGGRALLFENVEGSDIPV